MYLLMKDDHQECLEGLLLDIYSDTIKELSTEVVKNLSYLISMGFIQVVDAPDGTKHYKLVKTETELAPFVEGPNT